MAKKEKENGLASILAKYSANKEAPMVQTGIIPIDKILGGGINPGSMYTFWGTAGCGKSTIAIQILKSFCSQGMRCAWIDVEKALNVNQQIAFGIREYVENGMLLVLTADTYGQADEITSAIARDTEMEIKLVVIDSETQLLPKISDDVDVESLQPGTKARQAATWLPKMKSMFYEAGIASIVLSHARANLAMNAGPYAPKDVQAGGYALRHVPDCILQLSAGGKLGEKGAFEGNILHMMCEKNKFTSPFQKIDAKLYFGKGINNIDFLIDWAIDNGVIEQSGAFYKFGGQTIRGQEALRSLPEQDLAYIREQYDAMNPPLWQK